MSHALKINSRQFHRDVLVQWRLITFHWVWITALKLSKEIAKNPVFYDVNMIAFNARQTPPRCRLSIAI